jgi:hypothetical protein
MKYMLSVGDVARRLGVRPQQITDLCYKRELRDDLCPIVAGRRLIPPDYVKMIAMALRRKGIEVSPAEDTQEGGSHVHTEN